MTRNFAIRAALAMVALASMAHEKAYSQDIAADAEAARAAKAMPYVKALAYAGAIGDYCFAKRALTTIELKIAATHQSELLSGEDSPGAVQILIDAGNHAAKHLAGDQAACQPAIEFVERTVATLPDAELRRLTDEQYTRHKSEVQRKADKQSGRLTSSELTKHVHRKADEAKRKAGESLKVDELAGSAHAETLTFDGVKAAADWKKFQTRCQATEDKTTHDAACSKQYQLARELFSHRWRFRAANQQWIDASAEVAQAVPIPTPKPNTLDLAVPDIPTAQTQEDLSPQVKAEIEKTRAFCKYEKDQKDQELIMGVDFIERRDINGDGIDDFILNYDDASCGKLRSLFCGTGGCTIQVFVSVSDEGYVTVWDDVAFNVRFERLKGRPAMILEVHGSNCGRVGADGHCRSISYWNGRSEDFTPFFPIR